MSYITQTKEIGSQTKAKETKVNGISVANLIKSEEAIKDDGRLAKFNFRAKGKWINGAHSQVTINDLYGACQTHGRSTPFVYGIDEPGVLLGEDYGANPVEFALAALSGCLMTTFVFLASAQGVKIEKIESTLSGDLDAQGTLGLKDDVRNGYEKIKVDFKVTSNAPKEKTRELIELAKKRSPVFDIISNPTPVDVSFQE